MKNFSSWIAIAAKLMLLGCFVFMNGNCAEAAIHERPCHAPKVEHQQKNHDHNKEGCGHCQFSQRAWSTPATLQAVPTEKLFPVWEKPVLFSDFEYEFLAPVFEIEPKHDPPEDLFVHTYPRIFRSTRWKTSGR